MQKTAIIPKRIIPQGGLQNCNLTGVYRIIFLPTNDLHIASRSTAGNHLW